MHVALTDLKLDQLFIVHPGEARNALGERISAVGLRDLEDVVRRLRLRR